MRKLKLFFLMMFLFVLCGCQISGTITHGGVRLANVEVQLTGDVEMITMTDKNGRYTFNFVSGDFTVTPVLESYSFNPESKDVSVENIEILNKVDFDASIYWNKTFGGSYYEHAYSVQQTTDGGYIVAGPTSPEPGAIDAWLIKIDGFGNEEWNKSFGGIIQDMAYSVQQTTDGGYILAGRTTSYDVGLGDAWLIKTDEYGNEEWNNSFGGSNSDMAWSVQQTTDGGYIVAGETGYSGTSNSDVWLIKTDEYGNEEWNKIFGGSNSDSAHSVQQTTDGGYIVAGHTFSFGSGWQDIWIIKTDGYGNEEWNKTFGGSDLDFAYSIQQTTDGGYILAGGTSSYGVGNSDVWLIKTDEYGNEEWNKTFGEDYFDLAWSVQQTTDGGYIVAGEIESYVTHNRDVWLIKTDEYGNEEWNKIFGDISFDCRARSVQQTTDGGYIVAGDIESYGAGWEDFWLIKTDSSGNSYPTP